MYRIIRQNFINVQARSFSVALACKAAVPKPQPVWEETPKCTKIFINNEWCNSVSGKTFETINPATGKKIADVQEGDKADVDKAAKVCMIKF
jgi:hypothetical protein